MERYSIYTQKHTKQAEELGIEEREIKAKTIPSVETKKESKHIVGTKSDPPKPPNITHNSQRP